MSTQEQLQVEILQFWFGSEPWQPNPALWWSSNAAVDDNIRDLFSSQVEAALSGALDSWADTADGALSLVLLLDQFTRHIYRGTARAFAGDSQALTLTLAGLDRGYFTEFNELATLFFLMPLEHSENLKHQDRCIEELSSLLVRSREQHRATVQSNLDYAYKHQAIIAKFGRFPHRNTILGRSSTRSEQQYLDAGGPRFGQ